MENGTVLGRWTGLVWYCFCTVRRSSLASRSCYVICPFLRPPWQERDEKSTSAWLKGEIYFSLAEFKINLNEIFHPLPWLEHSCGWPKYNFEDSPASIPCHIIYWMIQRVIFAMGCSNTVLGSTLGLRSLVRWYLHWCTQPYSSTLIAIPPDGQEAGWMRNALDTGWEGMTWVTALR